jgi:hypothetical protein
VGVPKKIPPDELPSEDPGADTQRRFRYQAAYAAIRALDLLRDDTGREELICEHFEDILLKRAEGTFTGIQVNGHFVNSEWRIAPSRGSI